MFAYLPVFCSIDVSIWLSKSTCSSCRSQYDTMLTTNAMHNNVMLCTRGVHLKHCTANFEDVCQSIYLKSEIYCPWDPTAGQQTLTEYPRKYNKNSTQILQENSLLEVLSCKILIRQGCDNLASLRNSDSCQQSS